MVQTLRPEAFSITAVEGYVLLKGPGLVATFDVAEASYLSHQLLAACDAARLQQPEIVNDDRPIHWV
jgi:hypothetical protein